MDFRNRPGALGISRHDRSATHSLGAPRTADRALACHERLTKLMEDEPRDPEAPEQMARRQQRALHRRSARRSVLVAAGIDYEWQRSFLASQRTSSSDPPPSLPQPPVLVISSAPSVPHRLTFA
eukprot:jgi/Tetstr1/454334/TSEL_041253.t1